MALWKEGSSRYMVGLLQYPHPSSFEDRFRCFVYEKGNKFGSSTAVVSRTHNHSSASLENEKVIFRVAQSGDATCLGLTPYEGSKTLTLNRGEFYIILQLCHPCLVLCSIHRPNTDKLLNSILTSLVKINWHFFY